MNIDRHTDVFFSDEDVARFVKEHNISIVANNNTKNNDIIESSSAGNTMIGVATTHHYNILPTADEYRLIREKEECDELHRSKTARGESSCVTVDSLPFVHDDSVIHVQDASVSSNSKCKGDDKEDADKICNIKQNRCMYQTNYEHVPETEKKSDPSLETGKQSECLLLAETEQQSESLLERMQSESLLESETISSFVGNGETI